MPNYKIADLIVNMDCKSDMLLSRGKPYQVSDALKPDLVFTLDEKRVKYYLDKYPQMNNNEWEYMLYGSDFYNALTGYNGMLLHASAVVVDDRAYLFSAPCGTGKSTHTSLWLKLFGDRAYIINDDKPAIRIIDGVPYVYGTPFSGKHDISKNTRVRLGGICFITQSPENEISPMDSQDVIVAVMEQTIRNLSLEHMDKMLTVLDEVLSSVKVYSLKCNMDISAARLSYETMSGEKFNG
ncbi:MAG: hypothetical protein IKL44_06750 [Clostridia bacterium]|nr:hypothetical protein [Clostridia bacterium]